MDQVSQAPSRATLFIEPLLVQGPPPCLALTKALPPFRDPARPPTSHQLAFTSSPARFRFHRRPRPLPQAVLGTFASQLSFLQAVPVALASSPGSFRSHTSIHALSQGFAVQRLLGVGCERRYSTAGRVEHWRLRRPRRAPDWPVCCRSFVLVLGSGAVDTVLPSVPSVRLSVRCSATGSLTANAHRNPHVAGPPQCGE